METETLDQKIRANAKIEHEKQVEHNIQTLRTAHGNALSGKINVEKALKDGELHGYSMVQFIEKIIIDGETENAQQIAVNKFMEDLERLK